MQIKEVKSSADKKEFLSVPRIIYRHDPYWISHLDHDIEAVFDTGKNKNFQNGDAIRWIIKDNNGNLIGRVAAFINKQLAYTHEQPTGGMGFFECTDNKEAAFALFDKSREWLANRGIEAMEGPVNFGEKDRYWGLLIDNAGYPPPYLMNYNPPYYKKLFESYGFKNFYEQYVYRIHKNTTLNPFFEKKYQRLIKQQGYKFETLNKKNIEKYANDFMIIYNEAWKNTHKHFKPLTKKEVLNIFHSMKRIIDPDIVLFVYHHNRPIAFYINLPELNQIFRYLNGKLNLTGKLKFLYYKWIGKCRTMYGFVFGIVPDHRNKGIESAMIKKFKELLLEIDRYDDLYISWIGDFNPKMIRLIETLNTKKIFTLVTYKKLFDPNAKFKRHPVLS